MRDFHMSEPQAMKYPLIRAFALMAFHRMNNSFCEMQIDSLGYVGQEALQKSENLTTNGHE